MGHGQWSCRAGQRMPVFSSGKSLFDHVECGMEKQAHFLLTFPGKFTECSANHGDLSLDIEINLDLRSLQIPVKLLGSLYLIYY